MNCLDTAVLLRTAESGAPAHDVLDHLRACPSCARSLFSLIFSLRAMKTLPDSPLFNDIPVQASFSITGNGFSVDHPGGFSLVSAVPVRGKRRRASLMRGPIILEPSGRRCFCIIIQNIRRSCRVLRGSDTIYRSDARETPVTIHDLGMGSYCITVDDDTFSFDVT